MDNLTPEQKLELRRTRERLSRARSMLNRFERRLEALHRDRSGHYGFLLAPPLVPNEWHPVSRCIENLRREAEAGCELSRGWIKGTEEQRARIATLRATRLPGRAPDYDGPWFPPSMRELRLDPEEWEARSRRAQEEGLAMLKERERRAAERADELASLDAD